MYGKLCVMCFFNVVLRNISARLKLRRYANTVSDEIPYYRYVTTSYHMLACRQACSLRASALPSTHICTVHTVTYLHADLTISIKNNFAVIKTNKNKRYKLIIIFVK